METKYFNNGFVGKAVSNANEAIKCFNAGMEIRDTEGEDFLYESVDGNKLSESESINLILGSLQENGKVYVGFCLEGHKVVPKNSTNLSCEFKVGQTVYFLLSGEITSGVVKCMTLATSDLLEQIGKSHCKEASYYGVSDDHKRNENFEYHMRFIQSMMTYNCVCIKPSVSQTLCYIPLEKVFSTKELLIQDLLASAL